MNTNTHCSLFAVMVFQQIVDQIVYKNLCFNCCQHHFALVQWCLFTFWYNCNRAVVSVY